MKQRVLFLCTHNSCRSQMAEELINYELGERFEAFSAGTEKARVKPLAAKVLEDLGVDTAPLYSKTLEAFVDAAFDHVVTLCGDAKEKCLLSFGGVKRIHIGFDDPSRLSGRDAEVLPEYRRVRDEIRQCITAYLDGADYE